MDRLSSDDLAFFRAALKARAQADACWNMAIGIIAPKYSITNLDAVDEETGLITRNQQQPTPLQPVQADEAP